jgi:predicted ABC-type ATPase
VSKRFLEKFTATPVRIDADDFRQKIPGYNGANSHIIQSAASLAVDKVLEKVFEKKYSFMLDGTFAIGKAVENLKRAHRRNYTLQIFFVYQDPVHAWEFTKARQKKEGRYVPKDVFINSYFAARENVLKAKQLFGDNLTLFIVVKDYVEGTETIYDDVSDIDRYLPKIYNRSQLEEIIL